MATPKKQKNGAWSVLVYLGVENGKKKYKRITSDTKADCIYKAACLKEAGIPRPEITVEDAVRAYIKSCEFLSPSTIAGYEKIQRTCFQELQKESVSSLDDNTVQAYVNKEARRITRNGKKVSAKTVINGYGLIAAALKQEAGKTFNIKLPKRDPKFLELPEPRTVIEAVRGTDIELPCMLAMWLSLSMSEVRGLKYSSLRNGCLYIDQVVVDVDGVPVVKKKAKVDTRNRALALPGYIERLIRATTDLDDYQEGKVPDGYLVHPWYEYQIRRRLKQLCPGITFHQLRHLNASVMLELNIPEKYAMERGGWKTPHVMKTVYQHTFSAERRKVDTRIDAYFNDLLEKDNKTDNKKAENA